MTANVTQQIRDYASAQGFKPNANGQYTVDNDETALKIYGHAQSQGFTAADLDSAFGWSPGTSQGYITANKLPSIQAKPGETPAAPSVTGAPATQAAPPSTGIPGQYTTQQTGAGATQRSAPDSSSVLSQIQGIFGGASAAIPAMDKVAQIEAPKNVQAVTATVPYSETTSGIIDRLLKEDGPYLERAKAIAREEMSSRGLLSSSIAAGAATGAAIDRAGAIASTDAGIYANQRIANMEAQNEVNNANANRSLQAAQFNAQAQNDQTLTKFNAATQIGSQILGSQLKMNEMSFDNLMQMDRMQLQQQFDQNNLSLSSYFKMLEMGYGSTLNKGEMAFGSTLRKDEASYASGLNKGEMEFGSSLKKGEMAFGSGLTIQEMGYGAQLDLMKMAQANGYDVQKMAIAQGYTLEQMSQALGFDLKKMQAGQDMDLQKLAVANGYDTDKMALDFGYRMQLQDAAAKFDGDLRKDLMTFQSQLDTSLTGRGTLANLAGQYASMFDVLRRDPNLDEPTKKQAELQLRADFKSQAGIVADLYGMDATAYIDRIGATAYDPASSASGNANGVNLTAPDLTAPGMANGTTIRPGIDEYQQP